MEQQLAAGLAERQIAEFVDDDDYCATIWMRERVNLGEKM
jgi:hypothetical protein